MSDYFPDGVSRREFARDIGVDEKKREKTYFKRYFDY